MSQSAVIEARGTASPVLVTRAHVVALRLAELAYAIDLKQVEALWADDARPASARARLVSTPAKAVAFGEAPVVLLLGHVTLDLESGPVRAAASARLYDFGVVALALRVAAPPGPWDGFVDLVNQVDRAAERSDAWDTLFDELRRVLAPALQRPIRTRLDEDFLLAVVNGFATPLSAAELQDRVDLAAILSGETQRLSEQARQDLLRQRFSYFPNDLVVIAWDRAVIIEPRGETDVAEVLEVANAQLLEMRYYDELLDAELPRMNDLVASARGAANWLRGRRYASLARRLYTLVAEVTELTEKVDNALQVTEDVYLARVYAAALDLFRVPRLSAAVDRKLAIIRETYTALHDEASGSRAEIMEAAILLLIAVEIVLALVRH